MREKILEAFKALGFEMREVEGLGHGFDYEGRHFLYMDNVEDEDFFSIAIPSLIEKEKMDAVLFLHLQEMLNSKLKYIKAYDIHDSLWLFYERELMGEEDFQTLIRRMVLHLEGSQAYLEHALKAAHHSDDDESENVEGEAISDVEAETSAEDDSDTASEDEAVKTFDDETKDEDGVTEEEGNK